MKTIEALKAYQSNNNLNGAQIAAQAGFKPWIVNSWLRGDCSPSSHLLLALQEFLTEKGYELDELSKLPDHIKQLRQCIFHKQLTIDQLMIELEFNKSRTVWEFFKTNVLTKGREEKCIALVARLSPVSQNNTITISPEEESEMDLKIREALEVFLGPLKNFLKTSSPSERNAMRKRHPNLFQASNILSATCSNKAYETWKAEN